MAFFLNPNFADEEGLVAIGGNLQPDRLVEAYSNGIFPWPEEGWPLMWWSPDPRAIFELDGFHASRRLLRTIRSGRFQVSFNQAFPEVMRGCANRLEGTWITRDMIQAYCRMHELGHAHSVETWYQGQLAGGVYGIALGGLFAGESMFHRVSDGSKVALYFLVEHLRKRGFQLFDIQLLTEHTQRLGAVEIPRKTYLTRLKKAVAFPVTFMDSSETSDLRQKG